MVTISNQQRDNAVDFLRRLVDLTQSLEKGSLRVQPKTQSENPRLAVREETEDTDNRQRQR